MELTTTLLQDCLIGEYVVIVLRSEKMNLSTYRINHYGSSSPSQGLPFSPLFLIIPFVFFFIFSIGMSVYRCRVWNRQRRQRLIDAYAALDLIQNPPVHYTAPQTPNITHIQVLLVYPTFPLDQGLQIDKSNRDSDTQLNSTVPHSTESFQNVDQSPAYDSSAHICYVEKEAATEGSKQH